MKMYLMLVIFLSSFTAQAAVTSCENLTESMHKERCEFVKSKRIPEKENNIPLACKNILDDRGINRFSTYTTNMSACIVEELKKEAEKLKNNQKNKPIIGEDGTALFLEPKQSYGSCHYMQAQGWTLPSSCDQFSNINTKIKSTIPTKEIDIPSGALGKGEFLLSSGTWESLKTYKLYIGSHQNKGLVQNVSFFDDHESIASYNVGLSLLLDPPPLIDNEKEGGYARIFLKSAPEGIFKNEYPSKTSWLNAIDPNKSTNPLGLSNQDIDVSFLAQGDGARLNGEHTPDRYGIFEYALEYTNTFTPRIHGQTMVVDAGQSETCPEGPGPTPPSSVGVFADYPPSSTCGGYGTNGNIVSTEISCVQLFLYEWWYTTTCDADSQGVVTCTTTRHDRKTPCCKSWLRKVIWDFYVDTPCKIVNVNLVNTF